MIRRSSLKIALLGSLFAGVFLSPLHLISETSNPLEPISPDQNAEKLFQSIPAELQNLDYAIYTSNKNYDTERFNFNKRFNVFSHAIFTPTNAQEVAFVLKSLKKNKLNFAIRSGGHCYEPASLSTGFIIDLRNFKTIQPDVKNEEVYIGAGAESGAVIETLGKLDYAIPTGTCPSVGIGGLALGGGIGPLVRSFGLTCDSIKSISFINANGELMEVTEKSHPDLFWALRGAGNGSFGIVLGFTFKMYAVPKVSYLELTFGDSWDTKVSAKVLKTWQTWAETLPDSMNTQLQLRYINGKSSIKVVALKVGPEKCTEWEKAFSELTPGVKTYGERYLDTALRWAQTPTQPFQKGKSKILMKPITYDVVETAVNYFENLEETEQKFDVAYDFEAFGGAVAKGDSAFYPRKAFGWWHMEFFWDDPYF